MPVRELMTAAPPVNSMAVTRILVMMPNTAKTLRIVSFQILCFIARHGFSQVSDGAESRLDNLEKGMGIRSASLELNRNTGKEQNLDRSSRSVPEGTRHAILVSHSGALQEGSGPGPGGNDS